MSSYISDTILYISCFDANAGIFETLLTPEDAVVSDQLNHASIIDGKHDEILHSDTILKVSQGFII